MLQRYKTETFVIGTIAMIALFYKGFFTFNLVVPFLPPQRLVPNNLIT
jgi:hypothetical protein